MLLSTEKHFLGIGTKKVPRRGKIFVRAYKSYVPQTPRRELLFCICILWAICYWL